MRQIIPAILAAALVLPAMPQTAQAKGCVRGAVAGGVAGHYAGHHAVMGAVGGCLVARHYYKKKAQEQARQHQMNAPRH
jgi:uncharacterized protein YcfJ